MSKIKIKRGLGLLVVLGLFTPVFLFTAGCKTMTSTNAAGVTVTNSAPDVDAMASIAKSAAYLGTSVYLNGLPPRLAGHPQDRPAFVTARSSLKALIAAGTFSMADLTAALQALPVKEMQGSEGTLIVGEEVILWDQYGRQLARLDKAQVFAAYILPVAKAIYEGLDMALGAGP